MFLHFTIEIWLKFHFHNVRRGKKAVEHLCEGLPMKSIGDPKLGTTPMGKSYVQASIPLTHGTMCMILARLLYISSDHQQNQFARYCALN